MGAAAESVTVRFRKPTGFVDDLGDEVYEYEDVLVDGVMVVPGEFGEPSETNRPDGVKVDYTLFFPRSFGEDIANCSVIVRGSVCGVVGLPKDFPVSGPNFKYRIQAKVGRVDG